MNKQICFNDGWHFVKTDLGESCPPAPSFQPVEIPHDWLIEDTTDLYQNSIGWYRKNFYYDGKMDRVTLLFDGVYMDSQLSVNGQFIGEWKYGYSSFEMDITSALSMGENEIALQVTHQSPNSRWYTGAGIYRNVWLKTSGTSYLVTDGVYISTKPATDDQWKVEIETECVTSKMATLVHTLEKNGEKIAQVSKYVTAELNQQEFHVHDPLLWDTDSPNLYNLTTELWLEGTDEPVECITNPVGFRTFTLSPTEGFLINGKKKKIYGVCEHHDLGALGAAFNPVALKRRLELLKQMGVNGIRTAHNMPANELMHLADEMGFYVVTEAFDMWERPKTTYDYARFFPGWVDRDIKSWVRRDRNHPSLIMWSIGNEIYDTHADERGQEITRQLKHLVEQFDPKGNGAVTIGSNYMPWENAQHCADIVKIAGYNYGEKYYPEHHAAHPDWVIYGSETASVVQSRGIYHFPYRKSILADDDLQCSALGNSSTSWGARSVEACLLAERDAPYSLGQFIWTGFDYIGEPTPYHTKNSYFGQLDTATFPKDSYYIYQSNWTDYKDAPMVHIFPYWDFNPGQLIDVRVATNAPYVELYLNDTLVGAMEIDKDNGSELVATFPIQYQPGELKAIAYDETKSIIAVDTQHSFKDAAALTLHPDKEQLLANGTDLIFVEIGGVDADGFPVRNASNRVEVSVTGAGRLIGLDNGDSTDYDQYKGINRRFFSGKLMAIVAATHEVGDIQVTVQSTGLESCTLHLRAVPAAITEGFSQPLQRNQVRDIQTGQADEIPLRKIELHAIKGQAFSPERQVLELEAQLYPANATYNDLEWSVVTEGGIPTNLAVIESNGTKATVTAQGDGHFRVRCTSKNGLSHVNLISELEMSALGLGPAYKNPYEFISAGLFDASEGDVTNGNERGIASSRDGKTVVGYHQIDFGKYGSDTVTLPIFSLSNSPYTVEIWEGAPNQSGSTLLADEIYQKESIWNVYQPVTYTLSKTLTGLVNLYFVFTDKVHLKGFTFEAPKRAYQMNRALDADQIYGDSFKRSTTAVEEIGNNVSLIFEEMDFGEKGCSRLTLAGHSPIDKNTIHVRFEDSNGQINQMIEFTHSKQIEARTFELQPVYGKQTVTFIFLPGSQFDFEWFRFE